VRVERRPASTPESAGAAGVALAAMVKNTIGVTVLVEVVEPQAVERSTGKMRRVIDNR
jgi:phenylacetate-CoA ligase